MRIKLIGCDVFARLAYSEAAVSQHIVDVELFPLLAHNDPERLKGRVQATLDRAASQGHYDKAVLAYGLCGNAAVGLTAPLPMAIPRMHDCCAMFMGSKERYLEVFGHRLSARWSSCGYYERCAAAYEGRDYQTSPAFLELAARYGMKNAEYVWQTLHPHPKEAVYIQIEGFERGDSCEQYISQMAEIGCAVETVPGDSGWFKRLVNGPWSEKEFLELLPGEVVAPVYDMEEVFRKDESSFL